MDTFAESPPMSTFLLALAIFDFSSLTSHDGQFSSWTIPSKIHLVEHGHNFIPAIVGAMESITGSELPVPKIDQIALPQLNPVAMENWGMNTYRLVNQGMSNCKNIALRKCNVWIVKSVKLNLFIYWQWYGLKFCFFLYTTNLFVLSFLL